MCTDRRWEHFLKRFGRYRSQIGAKTGQNRELFYISEEKSLYEAFWQAYEVSMNKGELVEAVQGALGGDASKKDAENALATVLDSIADGVRKDQVVQVIGFGTFKVKHRAARQGRNPKTGETIQIKASKSVGFSPSAALKGSL